MYDMIIIGAGPAGLSAAIYGIRAGKSVLVLEGKTYGGQIINTPEVENYPGIKKMSGFEFAKGLYEQAKDLGAQIKMEKVISVEKPEGGEQADMEAAQFDGNEENHKKEVSAFVVNTSKNSYEGGTLILAMGAKNRLLGLPGEQELTGAGISYCATCDGMFYRNKIVAVNGGGSTA